MVSDPPSVATLPSSSHGLQLESTDSPLAFPAVESQDSFKYGILSDIMLWFVHSLELWLTQNGKLRFASN